MPVLSPFSKDAIYCKWSRPAEHERRKTSKIEQVALVAWRPELGPAGCHTHQLDRAEPIRKMDGEDRYEEKRGNRQTNERDESSEQDSQAADELSQNG